MGTSGDPILEWQSHMGTSGERDTVSRETDGDRWGQVGIRFSSDNRTWGHVGNEILSVGKQVGTSGDPILEWQSHMGTVASNAVSIVEH